MKKKISYVRRMENLIKGLMDAEVILMMSQLIGAAKWELVNHGIQSIDDKVPLFAATLMKTNYAFYDISDYQRTEKILQKLETTDFPEEDEEAVQFAIKVLKKVLDQTRKL